MSIVSDPTANNLQAALHLLSQRLEALQDNVANVSTPGFTARRIEFEDELALAVADGNPFAAKAREVASDDPRDGTGNNVNLGKEMVQLTGDRWSGSARESQVKPFVTACSRSEWPMSGGSEWPAEHRAGEPEDLCVADIGDIQGCSQGAFGKVHAASSPLIKLEVDDRIVVDIDVTHSQVSLGCPPLLRDLSIGKRDPNCQSDLSRSLTANRQR